LGEEDDEIGAAWLGGYYMVLFPWFFPIFLQRIFTIDDSAIFEDFVTFGKYCKQSLDHRCIQKK